MVGRPPGQPKTGGRKIGSRDLKPRLLPEEAVAARVKQQVMARAKEVPIHQRVNIEELARSYAPAVMQSMFDVAMNSPSHPARVAAANIILTRAYGMPTQAVQVSGAIALKMMSDAELEALANRVSAVVPVIEGPIHDVASALGELESATA